MDIYLFNIYLFIYSASPINYMYMKTTNQNSHTNTHTQRKEKKKLYGRDTTTAFANYCGPAYDASHSRTACQVSKLDMKMQQLKDFWQIPHYALWLQVRSFTIQSL